MSPLLYQLLEYVVTTTGSSSTTSSTKVHAVGCNSIKHRQKVLCWMLLPIKYTVHDKAATGSMNNEYIYIYIYILVCISIVDVCCLGYFESINPGPYGTPTCICTDESYSETYLCPYKKCHRVCCILCTYGVSVR